MLPKNTLRKISNTLLLTLMILATDSRAFIVTINSGPRAVYLRVGDGVASGTFSGGGTVASGGAISLVQVSVAAAQVGNSTLQPMSGNGRLTSDWDNYAFCNAGQVYIGGFYRNTSGTAIAPLQVNTVTPLNNGSGNTIPFSQISWTMSGNNDASNPIANGNFNDGTQTLVNISRNQWIESCFTFSYKNMTTPPAGTYTGRVIYTLTAP
ncbi:MAG: hypothetical protein NVS3B3_17180 [Aquirhabdus sp.]